MPNITPSKIRRPSLIHSWRLIVCYGLNRCGFMHELADELHRSLNNFNEIHNGGLSPKRTIRSGAISTVAIALLVESSGNLANSTSLRGDIHRRRLHTGQSAIIARMFLRIQAYLQLPLKIQMSGRPCFSSVPCHRNMYLSIVASPNRLAIETTDGITQLQSSVFKSLGIVKIWNNTCCDRTCALTTLRKFTGPP